MHVASSVKVPVHRKDYLAGHAWQITKFEPTSLAALILALDGWHRVAATQLNYADNALCVK
ncbi:hypothetical protein N7486_008272 [Penicillium sp. IBT 16267x]|nr:hypothetical protein N7486_008272 [Penicillium sp. IBT 16267x]